MFTCYNGSRFLDEELAISAPRAQAPALSTIAICQIIHYFICQIIFSVISPIFWKKSTISSYNFKSRRHIMRLGGVYFFRNASQLFQCRTYKKFLHMLLKTFQIFIRGHHNTLVTCKATMCNRVWSDLFLAKEKNQIDHEYT